jgi:hypothetical protein
MPLTGRAMIKRHQLLELVDQMRLAVPRSIQDAQEILDRREQIITQSLSDAKRVKAAAENESRTRLEESELVKAAKRRYDEVLQEAETQGRHLLERVQQEIQNRRAGADQYAREVLAHLEQELADTLNSVRRGLNAITPKDEGHSALAKELAAKN